MGVSLRFFSQSHHLKVFLPKKQYESIKIENGNGQVQVEQMKIKNVKVTLINGEVELNNLTAENIRVELTNGKIQLKDVEGRNKRVNSERRNRCDNKRFKSSDSIRKYKW